jgi:nucleoside 2-deoxyribosyltransferase
MISSTIQDFKDARKILKETLAAAGYKVLISEDGSIVADSSEETYESCFKAIEQSDIIIFLIGSRYGSLYDEKSGVSITRQEYRYAKTIGKQHFVFVDSGVWTARSVYRAYKERGLPFVESTLMSDVRVIDFIDEVDKEKKWIHQFADVSDLVRQVRQQLNIVNPAFELYFQPMKGNRENPDGSLNYEIGFKNISGSPLFEFYLRLKFAAEILDIQYDFRRSAVNLTGGRGLSDDKTSFEWIGQMLPTGGWIVFVLKSRKVPIIESIVTKHHGRYVSDGKTIYGTG